MRIVIVTQEEPFYLPPALDALCSAWRNDLAGMIVLPSFNEGLSETASRMYEFYGPRDFVRLAGRFAWAKAADRLNRFAAVTRPYSAVDVGRRNGVPLYQPQNINAAEFVATLRDDIRPDLLVSVAASQVLKRNVLDVPHRGCINLHSAPLPRYQGMMPNFWTMLHDEPQAAVTVHYMVEQLDAGDILVQLPVPIESGDSLHDLMVRSKQTGVRALRRAVDQIEQGTVVPRPMHASQSTYFSFPKRADAQRLRRLGRTLL